MAPSYANLFLVFFFFKANALKNAPFQPRTWLRKIDDIFMIWTEGLDNLKIFIDYLNNIHSTVKFTSSHSSTNIPFLDVNVSLTNDGNTPSGIRKGFELIAMGSNPVEAPKAFFGLTLRLLKSQSQLRWSLLHFIRMSAVHIIFIRPMHVDRQYRPSIGWYVDRYHNIYRSTYRPILDRYPAGSWPITYRYGHGRYVGRHQWKLDQNIGRLSVESGSTCRLHVGRQSIEYRSIHRPMHRSMYQSRYPKRFMVLHNYL